MNPVTSVLSPQCTAFLEAAQQLFGLNAVAERGAKNPHYMYLPLRLSNNRMLNDETKPEEIYSLESPFYFLSGYEDPGHCEPLGEFSASLPSVSVLVGEAGLGKTEFVFQFCDHLFRNVSLGGPIPLPLNLATCRWMTAEGASPLDTTPTLKRFIDFLFGPVTRQMAGLPADFIESEILPAIHRGDIYLILDGVDELIANASQYIHFFEGIRALLAFSSPSPSLFRALLTLRLEFVSAMDTPSGARLMQGLNSLPEKPPVDVHFLHLDFLNDSWVTSYLRHRLPDLSKDIETLRTFPGFFELLRRPLFLQMLTVLDRSKHIFKASQLNDASRLIEVFVKVADAQTSEVDTGEAPYFTERDDFTRQAGFIWDRDRLASAAVEIYDRTGGRVAFPLDDIPRFLVPERHGDRPPHTPTPQEALLAVHKCPYLQQLSADRVVFSNEVLREYFVCRGILLDLQKSAVGQSAFDRLVLSFDMRRFLRSMVQQLYNDKEAWYIRTTNSYALDRPTEWNLSNGRQLEAIKPQLEKIRRTLLDSMTDPRTFDTKETRTAIDEFFQYEKDNLHPRYLMYNYEAVAVYLWHHRRKPDHALLREFEERLYSRAKNIVPEIKDPDIKDREGLDLLLERVNDIARRLQFDRIKDMKLMAFVKSDSARSRMASQTTGTEISL